MVVDVYAVAAVGAVEADAGYPPALVAFWVVGGACAVTYTVDYLRTTRELLLLTGESKPPISEVMSPSSDSKSE